MKEILTKTLVYRVLAFCLGLFIPFLLTGNLALSLTTGIITESTSLIFYYIFEVLWRKYAFKIKMKKGLPIYIIDKEHDKYGWFNVIEVKEDNKILIEVE